MTPEPTIPSWLWDRLEQDRRTTNEAHSRLRSDFNAGFDRLREEMTKGNTHLSEKFGRTSDDVLTIKIQREMEAKAVAQRSTWIALVVSGGIALVIRLLEFLLHK